MGRWLTEVEQTTWRSFLHVNARLTERLDDDLQARAHLALTDYEILAMLSEAEGQRLRMSDLAAQVIVSRSRLTYRVDRLVERGFIDRVSAAGDRRGVFAELTADGREQLDALAPGHVDLVRSIMFDDLSESDLKVLRRVFARIADACDADPVND